MRASELIDHLQKLVARYGDQECVDTYDNPIDIPECPDGDVFVVADTA